MMADQTWEGWPARGRRLDNLEAEINKHGPGTLAKAGDRFRAAAHTFSPRGKRSSGQVVPPLRDSWVWDQRGLEGTLSNTAPHYPFVDRGTRRHQIVPKRGKVLVFEGRAGTVFTRRVNHPGTKAQKIGAGVQRAVKPEIKTLAEQLGADVRVALVQLWGG